MKQQNQSSQKNISSFSQPTWVHIFQYLFLTGLSIGIFYFFFYLFYLRVPTYSVFNSFYTPSPFLSSLTHQNFFLALVVALGLTFLGFDRIQWNDFSVSFMVCVWLLSGLLVWMIVSAQYNYFTNQAYVIDRIILLLSWFFLLVHPSFITPLLCMGFVSLAQFNYGPHYFDLIHHVPLLLSLAIFTTYIMLKTWFRITLDKVLFCLLVIVATQYFHQGVQKSFFGNSPFDWFLSYKLSLELGWSWFHGWHWFLGTEVKKYLLTWLQSLNRPLVGTVLLMKLGIIFILSNLYFTYAFISFFLFSHALIFFFSGVLFWIWIVVDFMVIFLVQSVDRDHRNQLFDRSTLILSILLILILSMVVLYEGERSQLSTRYNYRLEIVGTTQQGKEYPLRNTAFAPYHRTLTFFFNKQEYLIDKTIIPATTSDIDNYRDINRQLRVNKDKAMDGLREKYGFNPHDWRETFRFKRFVEKYLGNYSTSKNTTLARIVGWIHAFHPPRFFYTHLTPERKKMSNIDGNISKVEVYLTEGFFLRKNYRLGRTLLHEIKIPVASSGN